MPSSRAGESSASTATTLNAEAKRGFQDRKFGLFVHWGIYAIHGLHEQEQWRFRVPRAEYVKLQQQWNPVKYDPNAWLDLAAEAGMKYICLTTKHHDGYCLWNTQQTAFNGKPPMTPR